MKVLELFSGTHSVGKVCKELGYEVVSLDMILPADIQTNIMDWDYKSVFKQGDFDIVWGSPPCTEYSALKNCWLGRKLKNGEIFTREQLELNRNEADKLVLKVFEIIDYFKPKYYFVENPGGKGGLKSREIMKDKHFVDCDYCKYCDWGYKKRTAIWTNKDIKLLTCKKDCDNMIEIDTDGAVHTGYKTPIKATTRKIHTNPIGDTNKLKAIKKHIHKVNLGNADNHLRKKHIKTTSDFGGETTISKKDMEKIGKGTNRIDRYRIPPDLIKSIFLQ